ncbi:Immunoglobulin subtype 2 domain and Immunoglobulin subtype domain and Fibronectin, type III domain and Immunoglobulin-like domain and Immunoglobulin I-set domain and Immunoglobulin V-set domain and Immunoglobulin-like fold domain-containing protein [Strongyloides ratti]|uniref:Uncharacterized protein n=1 Tax=Strongyloides ratti TaxID=34506 RepID=A0A090LUH4_STRRB|nr:Immunoglobulin subtype 2 domain and Immunoglobulin subtype domain and Fibronectin, type III domain and Immunoglobulin-like domain and Immunoglobulin I-set domain and Immunoglobulin V-set domain and Immunoglobulin-like fold domain-containing protein [Strongyloides ratti]CEF71264.1 Immunoglobulin subtype 2 domain and Immunoglobulin subtype domain and Fibronectin, type III domain and Immunoglobulin-like domain and Immunoglobulin I-set domain and Immunoglobulin V-set domain and Immunoglobulin-like 
MILLPINILGILLFIIPHLINGWEIKVGYSDTHVTIGKFYTLRCTVTGIEDNFDEITISFHKDGLTKPISTTKTPKKLKNTEEYYSVLMLTKVSEEDSGTYECVVNIDDEEKSSEKVSLSVVDAPQFLNPQPLQTPEEGSTANIKCYVKNHDDYDIYWTFNGTIIQEGTPRNYDFLEGSQILVIPKFDSSIDNGLYECVAAYHNTIEKMSIEVIGYARPSMTVFEPFNNTEISEGSNFAIQCQAVGKPKPTYEWRVTKNGIETTIETTDKYKVEGGLLTIDTIDNEDTGNYTCIASNAMGSVQNSVYVKVIIAPEIKDIPEIMAMKDDDVVVDCLYKSEGITTAKWYFSKPFTSSDEDEENDEEDETNTYMEIEENDKYKLTNDIGLLKLTINKVSKNEAGKYRCSVENAAGVEHVITFINIKFAPTPKPIKMNEVIIFKEDVVTLECEFEGMPRPDIEWYHNENIIYPDGINIIKNEKGHKSYLIINGKHIQDNIFGTYKCLGSNSVQKAVPSDEINIYLKEKPEQPTISCSDELSATKAICNIDPGPNPGKRPETVTIYFTPKELQIDMDDEFWINSEFNQTIKYDETITIINLPPNTTFTGKAQSLNAAGISEMGPIFYFQTDPPSTPEPINDIEINCKEICDFIWPDAELNGGWGLKYRVTFNATQNLKKDNFDLADMHFISIETENNKLSFDQLKPEMEYNMEVITITEQGESEPFIITLETPDTLIFGSYFKWPFGSFAKFLAISGIMMIIIITTIDLVLYITYRCGIIVFILTHCCGKKIDKGSQNNEDVENNGPESSKLLSENQPINVNNKKREIYGPFTTHV